MLVFPSRVVSKFFKYFDSALFCQFFKRENQEYCLFFFHPFSGLNASIVRIFNVPVFSCTPSFHVPILSDFFCGRFFLLPVSSLSNLNNFVYVGIIDSIRKYNVVGYVFVANYVFLIPSFFYFWDVLFFFNNSLFLFPLNYLFCFYNLFYNLFSILFSILHANVKSITEEVFC